jgi:conjugal transfer mating pair stabilization protein TraN
MTLFEKKNYKKTPQALREARILRFKARILLSICFIVCDSSSLWLTSKAFADPWKNLKSGDQTAQELLNKIDQKKTEVGTHPFYKGISKEATLTHTELNGKAQTLIHKDSAGKMAQTSAESRPQIKIDSENDPLIAKSKEILENPLEAIGGKGTNVSQVVQGGQDEILTCEEPGEDATYTCKSNLFVRIVEKLGSAQSGSLTLSGPSVYSNNRGLLSFPRVRSKHFVGYITAGEGALKQVVSNHIGIPLAQIMKASGGQSGGWVKVDHKSYTFSSYYINYIYQPKIKVPIDTWVTECDSLEAKVDEGLCSYVSKSCTQGKQTRLIGGVSVTKDCWQETFTYSCSHPTKDDCGHLRARGCIQINSTCKQKIGNACVVYAQTFQCKGNTHSAYMVKGGKTPFCLDGNCRDQSWEMNDEMMSSVAQLSLLKEMQYQVKNGTFFKGENNQCSKYPLSFNDCCGSGKGWGKSLGLSNCKPEEKLLSEKRHKRLCHYVGTYCAKKVLGQCVKKKSSFCCFSSKLLKAFHEQGRPQINLGWGTPKEPLCRGFTIEEIQKIDFSKLDLREVYEDLMKSFKASKMNDISKHVGERLETIKRGLSPEGLSPTPKGTKQPNQRDEA